MTVDASPLMDSLDSLNPPSGESMSELSRHYADFRCAQIPQLYDVSALRKVAHSIYERLITDPVLDAQEHSEDAGVLGYGFRLSRLDIKSESAALSQRAESVFREHGLLDWATRMAKATIPIVTEITGQPVGFGRIFLLCYREGDYIGPHGAEQDNDRHHYNLQFPLCYNAVGCMRVLKHGFLEPMYDRDGDARLLGPRMWHEVPPLLRLPTGADPLRLVVSLRLVPAG